MVKRRWIQRAMIGGAASMMILGMAQTAWAEEKEPELVTEATSEEDAERIVVKAGEEALITLINDTDLDIREGAATLEEEEEGLADIVLTAMDGTEYEFLKIRYADMQDPQLIVEGAFAYIKYTDIASGKEQKAGQAGELTYSDPVELFAVDDVYIRKEADSDSEILGVIKRGDAIEVLGETASHYLVKKEDVTGYTVRRCISEDEQEAIAAVQAEEAAREQIRREAEAAAAAAAASSAASASNRVTEVSREKFDDCDGSGHGYYIITYSDGSTDIQDY